MVSLLVRFCAHTGVLTQSSHDTHRLTHIDLHSANMSLIATLSGPFFMSVHGEPVGCLFTCQCCGKDHSGREKAHQINFFFGIFLILTPHQHAPSPTWQGGRQHGHYQLTCVQMQVHQSPTSPTEKAGASWETGGGASFCTATPSSDPSLRLCHAHWRGGRWRVEDVVKGSGKWWWTRWERA